MADPEVEARGMGKHRMHESCGAKRGLDVGKGVPSPLGDGSVEGAVPPPQKFFGLLSGKYHILVDV